MSDIDLGIFWLEKIYVTFPIDFTSLQQFVDQPPMRSSASFIYLFFLLLRSEMILNSHWGEQIKKLFIYEPVFEQRLLEADEKSLYSSY